MSRFGYSESRALSGISYFQTRYSDNVKHMFIDGVVGHDMVTKMNDLLTVHCPNLRTDVRNLPSGIVMNTDRFGCYDPNKGLMLIQWFCIAITGRHIEPDGKWGKETRTLIDKAFERINPK